MIVGLISDTHGYFDPGLPQVFAGVDHILHAGDIGGQSIIDELSAIAPVTAVLGNNDYDPAYRDTELIELNGCRILVHHIVDRPHPDRTFLKRIISAQAQVVVFGHTHTRYLDREGEVLWINPGYYGKPRPQVLRSVALLELKSTGPEVRFLPAPSLGR
jgi:putative phosphoesterase